MTFLWIAVGALGLLLIVVLGSAGYMLRLAAFPPRQRLWTDPSYVGLPFESVDFSSKDGVRLSGWFIPPREASSGADKRPCVVLIHGWPWNRLGTQGRFLRDLPKAEPIELLPLVKVLWDEGYAIMMFDQRNHGVSGTDRPMAMGWMEARDLLAALEVVTGRPEVDPARVGVLGFSLGGNTVLYSLLLTDGIAAAVAIQPMTANVFAEGFGRDILGRPLWKLVGPFARLFYRVAGGFRFEFIDPVLTAPGCRQVPVLFIQGKGDKWGSVENIAAMAAAAPNAVEPIFPETSGRYGGYKFVIERPEVVTDFFGKHLGTGASATEPMDG